MGSSAGAISLARPISLMRQSIKNSIGQNQSSGRPQVAGRSGNRPPPATDCHHSVPASRASMERMVGSGSEPTYLPLTNTSCAGLVLYVLGAANALEAVAITRATASADLVNMVVSPAGLAITPASGVRTLLERRQWRRESAGGLAKGHHARGTDPRSVAYGL